MPKYVLLRGGEFHNVVLAEDSWPAPAGMTKELFAPTNPAHKPSVTRVPPIDVGKKQFLFELFTMEERAALLRQFKIANTMSNWTSDTPTMTEGLYRTLVDAKENLDTIEKVQLAHADTQGFLTLCGYLGVFGQDAAVQASRISTIVNGVRPDGTYIET